MPFGILGLPRRRIDGATGVRCRDEERQRVMSAERKLVLVPVNGGSGDERAIDLAVLLAKRHHATITAVHVVQVPQQLALDDKMALECGRGEEVLHCAERCAQQYGCEIEIELLQARAAGPAIVDEAIERHAALIVMATIVRRRAGEVSFGRTTVPYVLKNAPCEVLITRRQFDE